MNTVRHLLAPNWAKPESVHCVVTTRRGGFSRPPYDSLNLGDHVGDQVADVQKNRAILEQLLPSKPIWLKQVHSTQVSTPQSRLDNQNTIIEADAAVTNRPNEVLAILTADCMPVLFASNDGGLIGAAHAGWRGLSEGILENTVTAILELAPHLSSADICVWLGPAIGPTAFEVGEDVFEIFNKQDGPLSSKAFIPIVNSPGKYLANLYLLAQSRLNRVGVTQVQGGEFCTYCDPIQFFSYRRDGETGRFASLIWFNY